MLTKFKNAPEQGEKGSSDRLVSQNDDFESRAGVVRGIDTAFKADSFRASRGVYRATCDALSLLLAIPFSFMMTELLRFTFMRNWQPVSISEIYVAMLVLFLVPITTAIGTFWLKGHYSHRRPFWVESLDQVKSLVTVAAFMALVLFVAKLEISRTWAGMFLLFAVVLLPVGRLLSRKWLSARGLWLIPAIVIDDGDQAYDSAFQASLDSNLGLDIMSRVAIDDLHAVDYVACCLEFSQSGNSFESDQKNNAASPHIVISLERSESLGNSKPIFDRLLQSSPYVSFLPPLSGIPIYQAEFLPLFRSDSALLRLHNGLMRRHSRILKRAFDVIASISLLILLSPVFLILALIVKLDTGPSFFSQKRIGVSGRVFQCFKFRSMVVDSDAKLEALLVNDPLAAVTWAEDHKLKNDPRITKIGEFMRRTSLDELPQLINVLRGDMSIVGPRPIVFDEIQKYGTNYSYYAKVRPGITGLWQISGRNDVSYEERVRLDAWYTRNWSLWLDLVILFKTLPIVIGQEGAY